jgi:hypothetical protein
MNAEAVHTLILGYGLQSTPAVTATGLVPELHHQSAERVPGIWRAIHDLRRGREVEMDPSATAGSETNTTFSIVLS